MSISDIARSVPFPFRIELIKASRKRPKKVDGEGTPPPPDDLDTGLDADFAPRGPNSSGPSEVRPSPLSAGVSRGTWPGRGPEVSPPPPAEVSRGTVSRRTWPGRGPEVSPPPPAEVSRRTQPRRAAEVPPPPPPPAPELVDDGGEDAQPVMPPEVAARQRRRNPRRGSIAALGPFTHNPAESRRLPTKPAGARGSIASRPSVGSEASDDLQQRKSAMKEIMTEFVRYHAHGSLHPEVINPQGMYKDAHHSELIEGQYSGSNDTFTATRNPQEAAAEILIRREERRAGIGAIQGRPARKLTVEQEIQDELERKWMNDVYTHVLKNVRNNFDVETLDPKLLVSYLNKSYGNPKSNISHQSLMEEFGHHPVLFHMGQSQKFRHIDDSVKSFAQYGHLYDNVYGPQGKIGGPIYDETLERLRRRGRAETESRAGGRRIDTRRVAPYFDFDRSLSFAMKNSDFIIKAFNGYNTGDPWNSASTQTSFADNMSQEQNYNQALLNIANNQIPALFQRFSDKSRDEIDNTSPAAPAKPKRDKSSKGPRRPGSLPELGRSKGDVRESMGTSIGYLRSVPPGSPLPPSFSPKRVSSG